jgi:MYXO-CTERM domain-containing protein
MKTSSKLSLAAVAAAALCGAPSTADAFCGFYVNGAGGEMFNDATQVVLMRMGTRTVLSMQNNYKGPPEAFALVIPVPTVLQEADVKTLPAEVFGRVDAMGAPRLVEYWEQDPCAPQMDYKDQSVRRMAKPSATRESADTGGGFGVTIEAQFEVGEYQIVILSARDSTGLDGWLRAEKYQIPAGAEPFLRPYVEQGLKFFVAKVDAKKVTFDKDGRAALSPLRFHYDSEEFNLPIRLGLANSSGTQDLIVSILAPSQRYEVSNYKNVTIPTNLDVRDSVRTSFGSFYASLFDRTIEKNPGAVVTEYAWQASTCDPCPGPQLGMGDFTLLGADVLDTPAGGSGGAIATDRPAPGPASGPRMRRPPPPRGRSDFVLTRLHARYGKSISEDLVFKKADPIVGGREFRVAGGKLEERASPSSVNNFQARYAIRHWWTGPIRCKSPRRGIWGGPPGGGQPRPAPALNLAFAPRNKASLPRQLVSNVPEIGVRAYKKRRKPKPVKPAGPAVEAPDPKVKGSPMGPIQGCGCATGRAGASPDLAWLAAGVVAIALARRRRRA